MEKYKYDVAISFATEDEDVVSEIVKSLKKIDITPFFYKDESERSSNWGKDISDNTIMYYKFLSKLALVVISRHYINKKWTIREWEIIRTVKKNVDYILPLKLDFTKLDGLTDNVIYEEWQNNPDKIASLIKEKSQSIVDESDEEPSKKKMYKQTINNVKGNQNNNYGSGNQFNAGGNQYFNEKE